MANIFIYTGIVIMLLGALYGVCIAVKGIRGRKGNESENMFSFQFGSVSPGMKKLIAIWGAVMIVGFIITGIGLAIGLK